MKRKPVNTWTLNLMLLVVFGGLSYLIFNKAAVFDVYATDNSLQQHNTLGLTDTFKHTVLHNLTEPASMLLLQIIAILIATRIISAIFVRLGQPTVIAEIIAGIVLGPSVLGMFYPEFFHFLFAAETIGNLHILSLVGLVLFMFVIGMELSFDSLKGKVEIAVVIALASIIIPFFMGILFAYYSYAEFALGNTPFVAFALFIGISMSITAFPVLARIVHEKGLSKTMMGQISIASAAFNDVAAWCILAIVISISKSGNFIASLPTIAMAMVYILLMLLVIKPFLKRIGSYYQNLEVLNRSVVAFIFLLLVVSSLATQLIGIHALFGAFMVGVIMPEIPGFRRILVEKVEDLALTLLFPLFFVYTGLRTDLSLLNSSYVWSYAGYLILFAFIGKFVGTTLTARFVKQNWRDSLSIGALMNTHGLMEVVVLNIGYDMGIISPTLFAMMVIMALASTFLTSPLLYLIHKIFPYRDLEAEYQEKKSLGIFKVLISIGNPQGGGALLNLANTLLDGVKNTLRVTALHITPGADTNPMYSEEFAKESFLPISQEASALNVELKTEYQIADNIEQGVVRTTNQNNFDFLLVGAGVSLSGIKFTKESARFKPLQWVDNVINKVTRQKEIFYPGTLIKDKTRYFIEHSRCSVGVFINRGYTSVSSALIFLQNENDEFLIRYAKRLLKNNDKIRVSFIDENKLIHNNPVFKESFQEFENLFPEGGKIIKMPRNTTQISRFSIMLISYQSWLNVCTEGEGFLENIPSTLIINKKVSRFHTGYREKKVLNEESESDQIW